MIQNYKRRLYLAVQRWLGNEKLTFAPHGIDVSVPPDADLKIRYDLARGRPYEGSEAAMIIAHLPKSMPVIELGGCLGIISALIRRQIGPDATHIVVEANAELAEFCRPNAMIGAADGATQIVVAAVDYSGAPSVSFATGRMAHSGRVSEGGTMSVPTTTLAKLAAALPDGPFALICDIEGAEMPLVLHETALLARVAVFVLETHPKLYHGGKADMEALIAAVEKTGLRCVAQARNVYAFTRG